MKLNRWQLAGVALAVAGVIAGKQWYRAATPDEVNWLLSPIAHAVGFLTGTSFDFDPTLGWVSRDAKFIIAPVCAGLHFALAAFLALSLAWVGRMRRAGEMVMRLVAAAAIAFAATIVVDTLRISLALVTHADGNAHQVLGILVYLGALCALYAIARERKERHALA